MNLKGRSCWVVNIRMVRAEKLSLEAMGRFVATSEDIRFEAEDRQQLYDWVEQVLIGQQYALLGKAARGLAALHREDDRAEPGAGHPPDRTLRGGASLSVYLAGIQT
jgi:hypothetical protein